MQSFCPVFQKNKGCPCENPLVLAVVFVVFNTLLVLINCYEVSLISLVSFAALFLVIFSMAHTKIQEFSQGKTECAEKSEENLRFFIAFLVKIESFGEVSRKKSKKRRSSRSFSRICTKKSMISYKFLEKSC